MPISTRSVAVVFAVPLIALALSANFGFYTLRGMLAVLVGAVLVVAACLMPARYLYASPKLATAALYLLPLLTVAYLIWLTIHETNPLKVQIEAPLAAVGAVVLLLAYLSKVRTPHLLHGLLIGLGVLLTGATVLVPQLLFGVPEDPALSLRVQLGLLGCMIVMYLVWLSFLAQVGGVRRGGPDAPPQRLAPHSAPPGETPPSSAGPRTSASTGLVPRRGWWVRWGILLIAGTTIRALAVIGSPEPIIDVNSWLQHSPRFLLQGQNPYATDYPSPYGTERAARFHINDTPNPRPPTYPPLTVLTGLPAILLGVDARWMNVLAEIAAAVLLLLAGFRRGRGDLGLLASGLYLSLPKSAFMIEQAWFEPQLAVLLGLALVAAPRRPWLAGVALGGVFAGKQYALALLPSLVVGLRRHPRILWIGVAVAAVVIVPFFAWSPSDFLQIVVTGHLHRPVVYHALTLAALLKNAAGLTVPSVALWALAAVLLGLLAQKTPPHEKRGTGLWLAAALMVFCLCHTQGFPNYYYLALYLLLIGVVQDGGDA
ncbi:MAG: hypothetical protein ACYC63_08840 [Armatimonadota bacterium]